MKYYLHALSNYANFSGRARRKEYWLFTLFNLIFSLVAMALGNLLESTITNFPIGLISITYFVIMFIPGLAVAVRRLHDTGNSGWMLLVSLIPFIGSIWLFVLMVSRGDDGPNQYGEDPIPKISENALA